MWRERLIQGNIWERHLSTDSYFLPGQNDKMQMMDWCIIIKHFLFWLTESYKFAASTSQLSIQSAVWLAAASMVHSVDHLSANFAEMALKVQCLNFLKSHVFKSILETKNFKRSLLDFYHVKWYFETPIWSWPALMQLFESLLLVQKSKWHLTALMKTKCNCQTMT